MYPFIVLAFVWVTVYVSRIWLKERSLMKKEGFKNYAKNSYLLIFKIFENHMLNILFYSFFVCFGYILYINGGIEKSIKKFIKI